MFIFVVNLQLPRSFTKTGWAASVVLYWGVPLDTLSGERTVSHAFRSGTPGGALPAL